MNQAEQFYPKLHTEDEEYSAGQYHIASLLKHKVLGNWLKAYAGQSIRILDVGCGKGLFLRDFVRGLRLQHGITDFRVTGTDLVESPGNLFREISPDLQFVQHN